MKNDDNGDEKACAPAMLRRYSVQACPAVVFSIQLLSSTFKPSVYYIPF